MNAKIILLLIAFFLGNLKIFSKNIDLSVTPEDALIKSKTRTINNNDSIIFDLASATLTATYLDLPIYIKSDDVVIGIDYALNFNLTKLSYSIAIDILADVSTAFFNPTDLFLRYSGGSSMSSLPSSGNIHVTIIRFALSAPCLTISTADFTNISALINGSPCSNRVTGLNFSRFIPNANFATGPTCANTNIQFSDSSKISSGTVIGWLWNFGNGNTSDLQNNITSYSVTGAQTATLKVTASTGCTNTIVKSFTVSSLPLSSFSYTFDCVEDSVLFTNTSTIPSGSISGSAWYFGDFSPISNLTNPAHKYISSGTFKVKLTSTSGSSCSASIIVPISLRPADINRDGVTNVDDFLIFAPALGTSCNQ